MKDSIFVLYAHHDHEAYESTTEIIGTFKTLERAQERMMERFEEKRTEWIKENNYKESDFMIKEGAWSASIFDNIGGDYTEFGIVKCKVED